MKAASPDGEVQARMSVRISDRSGYGASAFLIDRIVFHVRPCQTSSRDQEIAHYQLDFQCPPATTLQPRTPEERKMEEAREGAFHVDAR